VVCIPYLKNRQFVGRSAELEILERYLNKALGSLWLCAPQRFAIFGPGGIGKTQLVLSLAYWVAEQQPTVSVFWLPATSAEDFECAAGKIAQQLGIRTATNQSEDAKELLRHYLSTSTTRRWLLIVDNADDTDILEPSTCSHGLLRCLPESPLGVTIFTTRSSSFAQRLAGSDLLRLKRPSKDEAAKLLTTALVDSDLLSDPTAVTKLVADLGHMPLAILQAAEYINGEEISIPEYSRLFRSTGSATSSALDEMKQQTPQRPRRRIQVPYAYPAAAASTVHYTPHDANPSPTPSATGGSSLGLQSAIKPTRLQRIKPCYLMISLGILAIGGSLLVGLFYSISEDRMGDGFTTAGWMVAVSTLVLAAPMAKHYPNCRCWCSHNVAML
jgi:hypothetical protein